MQTTNAGPQLAPDADPSPVAKAIRILVALMLCTYLASAFLHKVDPDEYQAMIAGSEMARGLHLYTDLWDNHGPLINYIAAMLIRCAPVESHSIFYFARFLMFLCLLGTAFFFVRLARRMESPLAYFPTLALLFLLSSYLFSFRILEFRADCPMVLLWTASLALWHRAVEMRKTRAFFQSGLLLGCAFWFSLKTGLLGLAVGAMFLTVIAQRRLFLLEAFKAMAAFGAGAAIPAAAMVLWLWAVGDLKGFWAIYVEDNTGRDRTPYIVAFHGLAEWSITWSWALLISHAYVLFQILRRQAPAPIAAQAVCSSAIFLQFIFLLPTKGWQSILPGMIPGSVVTAYTVADAVRRLRFERFALVQKWGPQRVLIFFLAAGVVTASVDQGWYDKRLPKKLRTANALLREIEPGTYVFSGYGQPFFRPRPFSITAFVNILRFRDRQGTLNIDVPAELDAKDVKYMIADTRITDLGKKSDAFLRSNYIPLRFDLGEALMAAGKVAAKSGRADAKDPEIEIRLAGDYYWRPVAGETALAVDGKPAPNPARLEDGNHTLAWDGETTMALCRVPPERWETWKNIEAWVNGSKATMPK